MTGLAWNGAEENPACSASGAAHLVGASGAQARASEIVDIALFARDPSPSAGPPLNDLYSFDPYENKWTLFSADSLWPASRLGHGFTSTGGKLYVHGGQSNMGGVLHNQSAEIVTSPLRQGRGGTPVSLASSSSHDTRHGLPATTPLAP
jgi:hypothetical protein